MERQLSSYETGTHLQILPTLIPWVVALGLNLDLVPDAAAWIGEAARKA